MTISKPTAAEAILDQYFSEIQEQVSHWPHWIQALEQHCARLPVFQSGLNSLVAVAEGSSRHALAIAAPFLESWTQLPVRLHTPNSLDVHWMVRKQYGEDARSFAQKHGLVVVSQSGRTGSVLRTLEMFANEAIFFHNQLLVTNHPESTLAREFLPTSVLPIGVGTETSIAATKTFSGSLLALMLWGLTYGLTRKKLSPQNYTTILEQLHQVSVRLESLLNHLHAMQQLNAMASVLVPVNHFILLSKGPMALLLQEAALKLIETSRNVVYTDNTESFKHGPKVMLSGIQGAIPNVIYLVPPDTVMATQLFEDIRASQVALSVDMERVFFITFQGSKAIPEDIQASFQLTEARCIVLPAVGSFLEGLFLSLLTFQLLSYFLAKVKNINPDQPELQKAIIF
jgi:glucosamine 6-phosphate synthetase-like amidotransferase/phosphosugar isomerase protein